jgi:hypothetical protein
MPEVAMDIEVTANREQRIGSRDSERAVIVR